VNLSHCMGWGRHREERSDAAIQGHRAADEPLDCFAPLAMTTAFDRTQFALALGISESESSLFNGLRRD
jgi:hypothetical protein